MPIALSCPTATGKSPVCLTFKQFPWFWQPRCGQRKVNSWKCSNSRWRWSLKILWSLECTMGSVHFTVSIWQFSVLFNESSLHSLQYTVQCTVYTDECTVFSLQYTVEYRVHNDEDLSGAHDDGVGLPDLGPWEERVRMVQPSLQAEVTL